jgi:hypothetical protein
MIGVTVRGPRGGNLDRHLTNYAISAINHFAKELKISKFKFHIDLRLHHKYTMNEAGWREGECGPISDRLYEMDVCLYGNWLSTLAHEMVHIKQYLRKEIDWNLSTWKGKKGFEDIDYWDAPWEIEARKLQTKLLLSFIAETEA